jgi:hypothetical protein
MTGVRIDTWILPADAELKIGLMLALYFQTLSYHPLNTAPSTQRSSTRLVTGPVEIHAFSIDQ